VNALAVSPDGRFAVTGGKQCQVWDVESGQLVRTIDELDKPVEVLGFSADGTRVFVGSSHWAFYSFDVATGELVRMFELDGRLGSAALSPNGRRGLLAALSVQLWDLQTGKVLGTLPPESQGARLAISRDGKWGLTGGIWDGSIWLCHLDTGQRVRRFAGKGAPEPIRCLAFSPDGRLALSGGAEGRLKLWDIATGKQVRDLVNDDDW
jgi:WD40 repeat protein